MFDEVLMNMLKNPELTVAALSKSYAQAKTMEKGLEKASQTVVLNPSPENLSKMVSTAMKCQRRQATIIQILIVICSVYASGSRMSGDLAEALNKMGRGDEAIREMFNQKIRGRS